MKFKYDKKMDQECWERIIQIKEMYEHKFPDRFNITSEMIRKAKQSVDWFEKEWNNANIDFDTGIKKIFGSKFPNIICYINTSSYSMDKYPNYISVSMNRKDPVTTVVHEASHYMFRQCFPDIPDIENIKEIITVINNDVFGVKDFGWKIHQKQREKALEIWKATNSIKQVCQKLLL